ncbi:MAG: 30S ribosomal protein S1 [Acidobacteriota bacterium]
METTTNSDSPVQVPDAGEARAALDARLGTITDDNLDDLDFGEILDLHEQAHSKVKEGQVVLGTVMEVRENHAVVDIGYKSEGMVNLNEFPKTEDGPGVAVGDQIDVLLERSEGSEGYVVLSKEKAEKIKVWETVERAYNESTPITGRIIERIKGGLAVDIGVRAFLPGSLVDVRPVRDLESLIDQHLEMRVIKVNRRRGNIVLSRKAILEEENEKKKATTLEILEEGVVMMGVVKNLTDYGAFIDLGGMDGLLHITDMSWGRVGHPSEMFKIGQEVEVVILKFDRETERVSLGYKQRRADPWEVSAEMYPIGKKVHGKVVSLTNYGAFVEIEEGIEGLIHVSEMSWTKKIKHPSQVLSIGQEVECMVLDLDRENRRISLGLRQVEPNPWEELSMRYEVGSVVRGTVRNLTDFGAFIEIEDGIDGLVHVSDLSWTKRVSHPHEVLNKGEEVEAVILNIDPENQRLSLGIKQLTTDTYQDFFVRYHVGDVLAGKVVRMTDFGLFVELKDGIEGLVHVSEIAEERVEKPSDRFNVGDEVMVKIVKLNAEEKKIGLSIREAIAADAQREASEYASRTSGSASASLGDFMSADLRRMASADAPAETDAPAEAGGDDATPATDATDTESGGDS